jgi:hypothetical protein
MSRNYKETMVNFNAVKFNNFAFSNLPTPLIGVISNWTKTS